MDFRFNVNHLLPKRINKITHSLIPEGFRGDRREFNECQRLLTRILDDIGEASAKAQGLNRTITSAVKLRDTDHTVYLMVDKEGNNGLGSVVGLLKTGSKSLFMFDENGLHYQLKPRCILDFYIHESQQRMGLGNELYQYMLREENLQPIKLAIDRPSDKFLSFLMKHYGLSSIIPQNNKFVVFKGFFDDEMENSQSNNRFSNTFSPHKQSIDLKIQANNNIDVYSTKSNSINGTPITRSAYGRYAASRPPCSMANIIHNTAIAEPTADNSRPMSSRRKREDRPSELNVFIEDDKEKDGSSSADNIVTDVDGETEVVVDESLNSIKNEMQFITETNCEISSKDLESITETMKVLTSADKNKVDTLSKELINKEITMVPPSSPKDEIENPQSSCGHLDLKFYHSPLW